MHDLGALRLEAVQALHVLDGRELKKSYVAHA